MGLYRNDKADMVPSLVNLRVDQRRKTGGKKNLSPRLFGRGGTMRYYGKGLCIMKRFLGRSSCYYRGSVQPRASGSENVSCSAVFSSLPPHGL